MNEVLHIIEHSIIDSIKLLPFLLIAFIIIELIEHKFSHKTKKIISSSGKIGPLVGAFLGAIPQCGFSVIATNLYITRIVSLGTLVAIYLATSDEMIPVLLANNAPISLVIRILSIKVLIGMIVGFLIDFIYKNKKKQTFNICEHDHCECEESLIKSALVHTLKTFLFIFIITLILNLAFEYVPSNIIENIFLSNSIFAPFLSALFGLIPNCASSVMLTELYLNSVISLGTLIGGLLTGSGIAIAVLFKNNDSKKESVTILGIVYIIGVISGIVLNIIGI